MSNPYFSAYNEQEQQDLYRDLIDECVNFFGVDSVYIPRDTMSEVDLLFGDDPTKKFSGGYTITTLITTTDSFDGNIAAFSKFGYTIKKQLRILVSYDLFKAAVESSKANIERPQEGDLFWMPNFQAFFEVIFVNQDNFFYAFGNRGIPFYGYELVLEEFRYNNEIVDSGFTEPDNKVNELVFTYAATMANGNVTYQLGETVYQGANLAAATATANVGSWSYSSKTLNLKNIQGMFIPTENIIGSVSGAVWELMKIELYDDINNPLDNNVLIRDEANSALDRSETDPMGNPVTSIGGE